MTYVIEAHARAAHGTKPAACHTGGHSTDQHHGTALVPRIGDLLWPFDLHSHFLSTVLHPLNYLLHKGAFLELNSKVSEAFQ